MLLTQSKYIRDLLFLANMIEAKGISTPMVSSTKMSRFGTNTVSNPHEYKSIVGAFQYLALTRPDITFSVNKVCQNMSNLCKLTGELLRGFYGTSKAPCIMAFFSMVRALIVPFLYMCLF